MTAGLPADPPSIIRSAEDLQKKTTDYADELGQAKKQRQKRSDDIEAGVDLSNQQERSKQEPPTRHRKVDWLQLLAEAWDRALRMNGMRR